MQNHYLITFKSRKLKEYERHYSIYDKEMSAIMHALAKFRQYLVGGRFKIKIDHNNLKYFLEQKDLNERTVALVHDVSRSSQGGLSLRAFRLSPSFMTAFKDQKFTAERLAFIPIFADHS